jgi:ribose-phosphate pyrophosphokinase
MSLQLSVDNKDVSIVIRRFPAGETFIKIDAEAVEHQPSFAEITLEFEGNDDLFNLALLVDAVRRELGHDILIELQMPYLPYARQDRVCARGESLSVKVACDFINGLKFSAVQCFNIHSDVGVALLDNLMHVDSKFDFLGMSHHANRQTILVSPDAGANKKVLAIAKEYGYANVVRADKTRDVLSGKITGTVVYSEPVGDKDFLIVDDICDGGRTFTELAKELRKLTTGKVMLYVTHGIFSAGEKVFDGLVDSLYTSNPVGATGKAAVASGKVVVV